MTEKHAVTPMGLDAHTGAIRAAYTVKGALVLCHGASGCTFNMRNLFAWHDNVHMRLPTTGMVENNVIFGGEELLDQALEKAIDTYSPELIVIQGTVIPFLIGDDLEGIANVVSQRRGVKILCATSPNYKGPQLDGYQNVVQHYVTGLMEKPSQREKGSVNLLGVFPGEYNWRNDQAELVRLLEALGLKVNCVLVGDGVTVQELMNAPGAEANVLAYPEVGLPAARLMETRFGVPYVATDFPPLGVESSREWILRIADFFGRREAGELLFDREMREMGRRLSRLSMGSFNGIEWLMGKTYALALSPFQIPGMVKFLHEDLSLRPTTLAFREYDEGCHRRLEEVLRASDLTPEILTSGDIHEYVAALKRDYMYPYGDPWLAFGSSVELSHLCTSGVRLPVIRMAFPVMDETIITDRPFMGLRGVVTLAESIFNALNPKLFLTDQAFGQIPYPLSLAEELAKSCG